MLQLLLLLGLFGGRYLIHPDSVELTTKTLININTTDSNDYSTGGFKETLSKLLNIEGTMPLEGVIDSLAQSFPIVAIIIVGLLIIANASIISRSMTQNLMTASRNYLPALFYIIFSCSIFFPGLNLSTVIVAFLLIIAFNKLVDSFAHRTNFGVIFQASLLIGLTPLLHAHSVIFILLIPVAMRLFKRNGKESFVAFFGILLPIFFFAYLTWAVGGDFHAIYKQLWELLITKSTKLFGSQSMDIARMTMLGIVGIITLASIVTFVGATDMRTKTRKVYGFAIWMLVICIAGAFLPSSSASDYTIIAIPVAYITPLLFIRHKGRIPLTLYIATLAAAVILNTVPFI